MTLISEARPVQEVVYEEALRSSSRVRGRVAILDNATRLKGVYEDAIKELQASLAKAQEEITVLKAEIAQMQTRAQQSAAASQAAIDSLGATVETGKETIEDLRRENTEAKAEINKLKHNVERGRALFLGLTGFCFGDIIQTNVHRFDQVMRDEELPPNIESWLQSNMRK